MAMTGVGSNLALARHAVRFQHALNGLGKFIVFEKHRHIVLRPRRGELRRRAARFQLLFESGTVRGGHIARKEEGVPGLQQPVDHVVFFYAHGQAVREKLNVPALIGELAQLLLQLLLPLFEFPALLRDRLPAARRGAFCPPPRAPRIRVSEGTAPPPPGSRLRQTANKHA